LPLPETFTKKFSEVFLTDDVDGMVGMVDDECDWAIMATGETFHGPEQIRKLAERSIAARQHTKDVRMDFKNLFSTEDQMVLEYVHRGIITKSNDITVTLPTAGTEFVLPICLVCHVKNGKFDKIDEYFDVSTLTGAKTRMYS
jgi:ketosteroid isomerase-like protein